MKILFIALANSSHTISWVNMFENKNDTILVYGINGSIGEYNKNISTYNYIEDNTIKNRLIIKFKKIFFNITSKTYLENQLISLSKVIKYQQPDIIHTLGFEDAGHLLTKLLEKDKFNKNSCISTSIL